MVLVGHSMGGLAIRCALDATCNDGGQGSLGDLYSKVADIITFGTPLTGSFLRDGRVQSDAEHAFGDAIVPLCRLAQASHPLLSSQVGTLCDLISALTTSDAAGAFSYNSPQLAALLAVPNGTPVLALAGSANVTASIGPLWHHTLAGDAGDLVVGTDSALSGGTRYGNLGGTHVEDCGTVDLSAADWTVGGAYLFLKSILASLICVHTSETSDGAFLTGALGDLEHLPHGRWTDSTVTITGSSL